MFQLSIRKLKDCAGLSQWVDLCLITVKKKWECQCETDDQSRGEKEKEEKKDLKMGGRKKIQRIKAASLEAGKVRKQIFPMEPPKERSPTHILILSNLQTCKIINLCTLTLLSLWLFVRTV